MAEFSTALCAHCIKYLNLSLVCETHCGVELEDKFCVPEDLGSYFVLIARAFERC